MARGRHCLHMRLHTPGTDIARRKIWLDRRPIELFLRSWLRGLLRSHRPLFGVDGRCSNIVVRNIHEVCVLLRRWMVIEPGAQPWLQEFARLLVGQACESGIEFLL